MSHVGLHATLPSPLHTSEDAPENDQQPLQGVVICCTSIAPEERDTMCAAAQEMGAAIRLDLTSEVTHLIVGATETPKYRYVAKERPEVKVLLPEWLEAVRQKWIDGGDVELAQLEQQYQVPTFWRLNICVTGFNDLEERNDIMTAVAANGASYHGDLTKNVTHLIAAAPQGKKYEYAGQWGIKIVTIEWFRQSLRRGMILEENLYSPTMAAEDRGKGAFRVIKREDEQRPQLGKRKSTEGPGGPQGPVGRRKLRRTASSKLESQNSGIWADIGSAESSVAKPGAEWDEAPTKPGTSETVSTLPNDNYQDESQHKRQDTDDTSAQPAKEDSRLIFKDYHFIIHGFDKRKASILCLHLQSNGGAITHSKDLQNGVVEGFICVAPHEKTHQAVWAELQLNNNSRDSVTCVTDWWVEKCIFSRTFIDPQSTPLYRPLNVIRIPELDGVTVTPTSFSGIDLRHFSQAVQLVGMKYDETLRPTSNVLVCGTNSSLNAQKLRFAFDNSIPVVKADWFWTCLETGESQGFGAFLLVGSKKGHAKPQARLPSTESASRKIELKAAKHSPNSGRSQENPLDTHKAPSDSKNTSSDPAGDLTNRPSSKFQTNQPRPWSQPLRTLSQSESNSQRQSQSVQTAEKPDESANKESTKSQRLTSFITEDDEPFRLPDPPEPASGNAQASVEPEKSSTQQSRDALNDAIAHLRAHKRTASTSDGSPSHRRRRQLGRAPSNPSSTGSRHESFQNKPVGHGDDEADDDDRTNRKVKEEYAPSQALMYEHEESKLVREKLLRDSITTCGEEEGKLKRVASVGKVKDDARVPVDVQRVSKRRVGKR